MAKTDNLNDFMTDLADSIREATGETESINAQSFSTRITGLGSGKQDKLVSGENIKTINGESILGSGDISIEGGGKKYVIGDYLDLESIVLKPNEIVTFRYVLSYEEQICIVDFEYTTWLEDGWYETATEYDEYMLVFRTGSGTPQFALPSYVNWANGEFPELEEFTEYELSITRRKRSDDENYFKAVLTPFKPA